MGKPEPATETRRSRRVRITSGVGAAVASAWGVVTLAISVANLPSDASDAWKAVVSAPEYIPFGIAALFILVLIWSLWPWGKSAPAPASNEGDQYFREELAKLEAVERAKHTVAMKRLVGGIGSGGRLADYLDEQEKDRKAEAEARRQRMIREASEAPSAWAIEPPAETWTPLDAAIRYIANESQWGVDHDHLDPHFYVNLGIYLRDALACGDMTARGRKFHMLRGGIKDPPLHPLIPIPREFWEDAFIDAYWPLHHGGPAQTIARRGSTVKKGDHEGMHDIRLDEGQVRALWPPARAIPPKAEPNRIPFAALRDIAMEYGLSLDHRDPAASNVAYALEGALKEAAANLRLVVWGRPYNGPVRDNDPLVAIPPAHFLKYSFRHGALHHVMRNRDICTTTIPLVAASKEETEGETFYDLHVSTSAARSVIKCFADERAGDD